MELPSHRVPAEEETWFAIHEVYYEHGLPVASSKSAADPGWTEDDGRCQVETLLERMRVWLLNKFANACPDARLAQYDACDIGGGGLNGRRLNFPATTRSALIDSVGANCVYDFPACCKPLTAYDPQSEKVKSIAFVAHAIAASPGGPRGQDGYTEAQIRAFGNGVVLCPTHATEVDVHHLRFPIPMMQGWQQKAIEHRQAGLPAHRPFAESFEGNQRAVAAVRQFMQLADRPHIDAAGPTVSIDATNAMASLILAWERDFSAMNPLYGGYPNLVRYQRIVVDTYRYVRSEVSGQSWFRNDEAGAYWPRTRQPFMPVAEQQAVLDGVRASVQSVLARWKEAEQARDALRRVASGMDQPMFPNSL